MDEDGTLPEAEELDVPIGEPSAADDVSAAEAAPTLDEMVALLADAPEPEPEEAPAGAPVPAAELAPELGGETEIHPEAAPESEAEPELERGAEAETEIAADAESVPGDDAQPATEVEIVPEPQPEPDSVEPENPEAAESAEDQQEEPEPEPEPLRPLVRRLWTRAPSWVATGAVAVFIGVVVYLLWPVATGTFVTSPLYRLFVFGGAALIAVDLITGVTVWLVARARADQDEKIGLAGTLWVRALAWTAAGVGLWWIGLLILDLRHAGFLG